MTDKTGEVLVTIGIAHYQTRDLLKLCIRAIRKFTRLPYEVVVVDNGSRDGSLKYLRGLQSIRLIERQAGAEPPPIAHAEALELAAQAAGGKYFLSLHTDAIPRREGWLERIVQVMEANAKIAAVGTAKKKSSPVWEFLKSLTARPFWKRLLRRITGAKVPLIRAGRPPYPRTFCALYRLETLRSLGLSFHPEGELRTGEKISQKLVAAGYEVKFIPQQEMSQIVEHIGHATAAINDSIRHRRAARKAKKRLKKVFSKPLYRSLLSDESLDSQKPAQTRGERTPS